MVKYIDSFTENKKQYIIMEYCDQGDMEGFLDKQTNIGQLSEDQILCFFTQLCLAMKHVHSRKILHRDLKTANLFLSSSKNPNIGPLQVKVGDFGVSKMLEGQQIMTNTFVGTPLYMAPEILQDKPYSNKTDIWSMGCILHNMCTFKSMI